MECEGAVGIEMLKFEAKGIFCKNWTKTGEEGLQPPPPPAPLPMCQPSIPVCLSYRKMKPCKTVNAKDQNL